MVYLIYSPSERPRIESLADEIEAAGYDVKFAPVGLPAGSDIWKEKVILAIQDRHVAIIALTALSIKDETVAWRFKLARARNLLIIPLILEGSMPEAEDIHPDMREIVYYNALSFPEAYRKVASERLIKTLLASVPKKAKSPLCFISYSRSDEAFASKLGAALRTSNIRTWRDAENIPLGANWDREIEKAILECTYLLFVATPQSVASENVMDELGVALNQSKTIIPLMLEECILPMRVHRAQWIDFRNNYDEALSNLIKRLNGS